jgi:hypothetical protein
MRLPLHLLALGALGLPACGGSEKSVASSADAGTPPNGASSESPISNGSALNCGPPLQTDAGEGCLVQTLEICPVPNGSTVEGDGAVITPDGAPPPSCQSDCAPGTLPVTCTSPSADLAPDPALNCRVVPMPTPAGVLFYCCPCQ